MDIRICQFKKNDLAEAMALKEAEGWNQTHADWEFILEQNLPYCFVAKVNGSTVATISSVTYQEDLAWIGMMIVDSSFRRKGISKLLMTKAISSLKSIKTIKLDATPAGLQVYGNLGFKEEYTLSRMVRMATKNLKPFQSYYKIRNIIASDMVEVAEMDKMVFGTKRENLLHFLFHSLEEGGFIVKEQNLVSGYLLCRRGTKYLQLGPLVARNESIAQSLIYEALKNFKDEDLVLDLSSEKISLLSWLSEQGFSYQRDLIRMYLENNSIKGIPSDYYLICGPEFG